jgi:hypothetical protein
MNRTTPGPAQLEWLLAGALHYGTSLASAVIGLGLGLALINSRFGAPKPSILRDMNIVTIGIAMFILLPVVRVIVMFIVYLRQRDYRLAAIALLVLTIILLGFTVGVAGSRHGDRPTSPAQVRGETVPSQTEPARHSDRALANRYLRGDGMTEFYARKMKVVRALDGRKTATWDARRHCCVRSDSL